MAAAPHVIALLAYEGFQLLDATGPTTVFSTANRALRRRYYDVRLVSPRGGLVASSSGVAVATCALARMPPGRVHTLLIAGAEEPPLRRVIADRAVRRWVPRCAASAARFGSICSGAFVLGELGLLDGKRVATHWEACDLLAGMYPAAAVDRNALYVTDGKVWTSAGVTTGIDMSLAMVEHDIGAPVANLVARWLVLYVRRPGYQSQFSPLLQAQMQADSPFAELIDWMQTHLRDRLDVRTLAARAGLSERSFYRKFLAATGMSPAAFVDAVRLEAARTLVSRDLPLKVISASVGLSPRRLNQAFERHFGLSPRLFRGVHRGI